MPDLNSLTNEFFDRREAMRPTYGTWLKHFGFFLLAFFTMTIAGTLEPFGILPMFPGIDPQTSTEIFQFLINFPVHYFNLIVSTVQRIFTDFTVLAHGLKFSISLL